MQPVGLDRAAADFAHAEFVMFQTRQCMLDLRQFRTRAFGKAIQHFVVGALHGLVGKIGRQTAVAAPALMRINARSWPRRKARDSTRIGVSPGGSS